MYTLNILPTLERELARLAKKNRHRYDIILKKVDEILENPHHYKNLRRPYQHLKRVHIDSCFVLTFMVDEAATTVTLVDFEHHDKIYAV
ncbi:MAG: hypothetical protein AABY13_03250 [Nanoarchaeota archaeon]